LLERERAHAEQKQRGQRREGLLAPTEASEPPERNNDADEVLESGNGGRSESESESEHDHESGSDSDDDDDDDEAELMKELARIKKEREEERRRQVESHLSILISHFAWFFLMLMHWKKYTGGCEGRERCSGAQRSDHARQPAARYGDCRRAGCWLRYHFSSLSAFFVSVFLKSLVVPVCHSQLPRLAWRPSSADGTTT
jgi:hypothetical protein